MDLCYRWMKQGLTNTEDYSFFGWVTAALNAATSGGDAAALPTILILPPFLWDSQLRLDQYRSVPLAQRPMPQSTFVSCPDHFRGTGKARESSHSPFKKKKKSSLEHLLYIVTVNFPSSICESFFLYLERWYKNMVMYRRREKASLLQSLSSVWEFFFFADFRVGAILLLKIVLPSPKWYLTAWMNKSA